MSTTAMNEKRSELLGHALALPETDRATIAQALWDSLPDDYDRTAHMKPDVREAWRVEIRRRVAEMDRGEAVMLDGEEVMRQLREKYAQ